LTGQLFKGQTIAFAGEEKKRGKGKMNNEKPTNTHPITIIEPPKDSFTRWSSIIHGLLLILTPALLPVLIITLASN
jgi:hypothetical protein